MFVRAKHTTSIYEMGLLFFTLIHRVHFIIVCLRNLQHYMLLRACVLCPRCVLFRKIIIVLSY